MLPPSYYRSLLTNEQLHHQPGASVVGCYVFTFCWQPYVRLLPHSFQAFSLVLSAVSLNPRKAAYMTGGGCVQEGTVEGCGSR